MKKLLSLTLAVVVVCFVFSAFSANVLFAGSKIEVRIDHKPIELSSHPFINNDVIMVPTDEVFSKLNSDVNFHTESELLAIETNTKTIDLQIGEKIGHVYTKYDFTGLPQKIELEEAPVLKRDIVYVPIDELAKNVGYTVNWDKEKNVLSLDKEQ